MTQLSELKEAIATFETVQDLYAKFGAADTEPCAIFHRLLAGAFQSGAADVPQDGDGWDLFTNEMNCTKAAKALTKAAKCCVSFITGWRGDRGGLHRYLKQYCWRVPMRD